MQLVTALFYTKTKSVGKQALWQSQWEENYWGRKDYRWFGYISLTFSISQEQNTNFYGCIVSNAYRYEHTQV